MKEGRPSQTAQQVALWRSLADLGLTGVPGFHDPTARHFLRAPWSWFFAWAERQVQQGKSKKVSHGLRHGADLLALRTMIIDEHVRQAAREGIRQLVILGAGLDGRAYRLAELGSMRVFEIDHPATQTYKKERAAKLRTTAEALTFVAVDFERDALDAALEARGHAKEERTVWLWEGVVMYLTGRATARTLQAIASRSPPGSMLIVNYMAPSTHRRRAIRFLLRLWREPQISTHTPDAMARELAAAGLRVVEDSGTEDWARRFHASLGDFPWSPKLRVAVARS